MIRKFYPNISRNENLGSIFEHRSRFFTAQILVSRAARALGKRFPLEAFKFPREHFECLGPRVLIASPCSYHFREHDYTRIYEDHIGISGMTKSFTVICGCSWVFNY